jgi:hypothetical protein
LAAGASGAQAPSTKESEQPKDIVLLQGSVEVKSVGELLECKTWKDLRKKATDARCTVLEVDGVAVVVEKKAFGLDALERRKKLIEGLLRMNPAGGALVLDPADTPDDVKSALQPCLELCSGYGVIDQSSAKPYVSPVVTVSITNGSRTATAQWFAPESQSDLENRAVSEDPKLVAEQSQNPASHAQPDLEPPVGGLATIQVRFKEGREYVTNRLKLMQIASEALEGELKRLGDALRDVNASLMSKLLSKYGDLWGSTPSKNVTLSDLSSGSQQWLQNYVQNNASFLGFASGQDAQTFLAGGTISMSYGAAISVDVRLPSGYYGGSSVVLSLGPRVGS